MSEKSETLSIYQRRVLKIPSPEFYIVYNGIEELKGQLNNYLKRLSPSKRPSAQKSQIKWFVVIDVCLYDDILSTK